MAGTLNPGLMGRMSQKPSASVDADIAEIPPENGRAQSGGGAGALALPGGIQQDAVLAELCILQDELERALAEVQTLCLSQGHRLRQAQGNLGSPMSSPTSTKKEAGLAGKAAGSVKNGFDITCSCQRTTEAFSASELSCEASNMVSSPPSGTVSRNIVTDKKKVKVRRSDSMLSMSAQQKKDECVSAIVKCMTPVEEPKHPGCLASIIESRTFDLTSNLVIFCTCCNMVVSTNYKAFHLSDTEPLGMQAFSFLLSVLYILEVCLRLIVHRGYFFVTEDRWWNMFDFTLACSELIALPRVLMQGQGTQVSFLRSLRLLKIARSLRVLHVINVFRELRNLLIQVAGSVSIIFWCTVFILCCLTLCSLVIVPLVTEFLIANPDKMCEGCVGESLQQQHGSVQKSVLTLFMANSGGSDWAEFYYILNEASPTSASIFLTFTFFFQFVIFNLLTSLFVDHATKLATSDHESLIADQRAKEQGDFAALMEQCSQWDGNGDGHVSLDEFETMIKDDKMGSFLAAQGLDVYDAELFFRMLTKQSNNEVKLEDFVLGCLRMKGFAKSIDVQALMYQVQRLSDSMETLLTGARRF